MQPKTPCVINRTAEQSPDSTPTAFPTPTAFQVFDSVIDDLAYALEERRLPDRRVSDTYDSTRIERRKTQRRKSS